MDDSDQDFTDLCSRLLKRVKKKTACGEERSPVRRKRTKDVKARAKSDENGAVNEGGSNVKEVVIRKMQQFKRPRAKRLLHADSSEPEPEEKPSAAGRTGSTNDGAQALQPQPHVDGGDHKAVEAEEAFVCQLCQKNLSSMSPQLRTQHINRCLDEGERSAPSASRPSQPRVPECPICGKRFKSEKSWSVHLKRCSAEMGVSPTDLLQALRRQAAQPDHSQQVAPIPKKKKSRRKVQELDEDTMVAMALSRSLLDQEQEMEEEKELLAQFLSPAASAPVLQWKPAAGRGRAKRRKGACLVSPPLLLIQDPQAALTRLQERVSSLLLQSRPPTPSTPALSPSSLPSDSHASLWEQSSLQRAHSLSQFYTSELGSFIQPCVSPEEEKFSEVRSSQTDLVEDCPAAVPSPSRMGTPDARALQDLVELAEEGLTLTQAGNTIHHTSKPEKSYAENNVPSSGFVARDPQTTKMPLMHVSKLASDLSSMVNNPQLSDVELQVDSGEVFFIHSFILYARCPLLANMVHESGFSVREDGRPCVQRVLLPDVVDEAVLALLQYLYSAHCPVDRTLLPHLMELAHRFGLAELQQHCEEHSGICEEDTESDSTTLEREDKNLVESNFLELLQSMWRHGDSEEEEELGERAGVESGVEGDGEREDQEFAEDPVDEEELEEIYEFAATQRKMENASQMPSSSCCGNGVETVAMVTSPPEELQNFCVQNEHLNVGLNGEANGDDDDDEELNCSLDKSCDDLFSQEPSPSPRSSRDQHNMMESRPPLIDLSISPQKSLSSPIRSSFPYPGVSPGPATGADEVEDPQSERVELIVLSDSSEDAVDGERGAETSGGPTADVPQVPPSADPNRAHNSSAASGSESLFDGSAEVSWLIPATPVHTCVSKRRTRLFPPPLPTSSSSIASKSENSVHVSSKSSEKVLQPSSSTPLHTDRLLRNLHFSSPDANHRSPSPLKLSHTRSSTSSSSEKNQDMKLPEHHSSSPPPNISSHGPLEERGSLEGGSHVEERAEHSLCAMEPPIAFDDSWGLNGEVESQKPCFSLRLDSSEGSADLQDLHDAGPLVLEEKTKTEASPGLFDHSLPDPEMWDNWEEEPRSDQLHTPVRCLKNRRALVAVTPMPGYSDMETPELKNRLNRFGVRPLPKKQMVLKLKEIHQYTHQIQSESEDENPAHHPQASSSQAFTNPVAPPAASLVKQKTSEEEEHLSTSQNSTTSSNAESDRSNPEVCVSDGEDDSDGEGITASQAVTREKDKLMSVRRFVLSQPKLYQRILQYQPLPLGALRDQLKAAGIRLGAAKLLDFLDSQCITFSTAKQGSSRRKRRGKAANDGPEGGAKRRRTKITNAGKKTKSNN